jgi:hypothetical protein
MVGVLGVGDVTGPYGQSRPLEGQTPSPVLPPPVAGTAIYGIGDVAGVFGDCDTKKSGATTGGTGVVGQSTKGKGVIGSSLSGADSGVYGQSLTAISSVPPVGAGVGVTGVGDRIGVEGTSDIGRGGVFASGSATHPLTAQVQMIPATVSVADVATNPPPKEDPTPRLSRNGQAGDLVAVEVATAAAPSATRLWFCITSGSKSQAAVWAEISFSRTIQGIGL